MDPALLAASDRPAPRYTSYPTAVQFTPSVGPVQHDAWLRDPNEVSASLYVHVPFCKEHRAAIGDARGAIGRDRLQSISRGAPCRSATSRSILALLPIKCPPLFRTTNQSGNAHHGSLPTP